MTQRLDSRVALVTGAGRGLGRAEAIALAGLGANVVVNDPGVSLSGESASEGPADDVVTEILASGGRATPSYFDCADWQQADDLIQTCLDEYGRLDILVNSAGILRERMIFNMDEGSWKDVVRVHLDGHAAPLRYAGAYWRERFKTTGERGGRVINTTSEAGLFGSTGQSNYVAAKAGVAALTLSAARELAPYRVCVNAISPRAATRMTAEVVNTPVEKGAVDELTRENMDPADVARLVAALAGPVGAEISGQLFVVKGGSIDLMETWHCVARSGRCEPWTLELVEDALTALFDSRSSSPPLLQW